MTDGRVAQPDRHQMAPANRAIERGLRSRGKTVLLAGVLVLMTAIGSGGPSLAATPADSDLYEQAILAAQDRNYSEAQNHLRKLLDANPNYLPARILLGEVLLALGDAQAAEAQLLQALNSGGDPRLILVALGQAELLQNKTDEVLSDIDIQTDDPALTADVSNLRGYAYLERGRLTEARSAFMRAAEAVPGNPTPYVGLARAALVENDPATAADYADKAFKAGSNGAVWRLRGDIAAYNGNDEAAIDAYGQAIDLAWGDLDARTARASLLVGMDRLKDAMADISAVRQIVPNDLEAMYLLAVIRTKQGKAEEADTLLKEAQRSLERILPATMNNNRTVIRMAGLICYALGHFSDATEHFERLVAISPSDDSALALLARARIQVGEYATAIRNLETALTINQNNPETQGLLGLVYMLRGELEEAQKHLSVAAASRQVPGSLLRQGIGLLRMHQADKAMQAFAEARSRNSGDDLAGTLLLAIGAMEQQDFKAAVDWSRKAVNLLPASSPDSAYVRHIAALALINDGDTAAARKELQAALKADKRYVPAMLDMARLATAAGDLKTARSTYRDALKVDRGNAAALLELADLDRMDGRQAEVEELLHTARDENPGVEAVWIHALEYYASRGDIDTVMDLGQDFIRHNPNSIALRNLLAVLLWRANHLEDAAKEYQDLVEVSLDRGAILYRIGLVREDMKSYGEAIEAFRRALGWLPDNNVIWRKIIILEARTGDVTEATRLLGEYRNRKTARDVDALTGELYLAAGNYQKSLEAFRAAEKTSPASSTVAAGIFESLRGLGQTDAALAHLLGWTKMHQDDEVQTTLALAYADAGKVDEAIALQQDTLSRHPESIPVLNNLALLYLRAGDTEAASNYASQAQALAPDLPAVLDTVGWIMVNSGQPNEGLSVLRDAQARAGGNARVHYHTAVALKRLGRNNEALGELKAATESAEAFPERQAAEKLLSELTAN